jgi:penicillin V acylase-like amidase (Ntn superfamily)
MTRLKRPMKIAGRGWQVWATAMVAAALFAGTFTGPARACTSLVQEAPDGPVFGANLDLLVPADGLIVINRRGVAKENTRKDVGGRTMKWVSRFGSVSFDTAGRGFPWSGMNEAGLVVSGMEDMADEYPEADGRAPFDIGSWTQYMLDTCATVDDVIALDTVIRPETDNGRPSHFLVADARGGRAAIEYVEGKLVVHRGDGLPNVAMTNIPYDRAQRAFERGGPRWWWSNPGQSAERFATAAKRASSYDPEQSGNVVNYVFQTLSMVSNQRTQWSVAYQIEKRMIWFRTTRHPASKWLSLGTFDFSCDAPSRMLDVLTLAQGNVEEEFMPYDRSTNLRVFSTMLARLGIRISPEDAVDLMKTYEGFTCAK